MVNESELLINVVIQDKPKLLTGLNQNGKWTSEQDTTSCSEDNRATGEKAAPKLLWHKCRTWVFP